MGEGWMATISGASAAGTPAGQCREPSSEALLNEVLALARRHLGMEVAFISRVSDGLRVFELVDTAADFAPIEVGEADPLEETYCGRVLGGRLPCLVRDASVEPAVADIEATTQLPIGTHVSVPVHSGGGVYGTLCCFSRTVVEDVSPRDVDTMRMFADIVGRHLQPVVDRARGVAVETRLVQEVLDRGGPAIALQPIFELARDTVYGYEALSRLPDRAGWGPVEWFEAAERVGLGSALEAAAVRNALRLLPRLSGDARLAVNVSARSLLASPDILDLCAGHQEGHRLVVEVTEHERIPDSRGLRDRLAALRAAGVRVAVDDAGSGFAGLEHILTLRPDVLKLDRGLVHGIVADPARQAMCVAMASFCRHTDAILVAEGVETHADLDTLRALRITHAQGYLLGRPVIWE